MLIFAVISRDIIMYELPHVLSNILTIYEEFRLAINLVITLCQVDTVIVMRT
jgi:hypothetical protein